MCARVCGEKVPKQNLGNWFRIRLQTNFMLKRDEAQFYSSGIGKVLRADCITVVTFIV